jgi:hypothetical protein
LRRRSGDDERCRSGDGERCRFGRFAVIARLPCRRLSIGLSGSWTGTRRTAADELVAQLDLIAAAVTATAERLYEGDAQRLRDHTTYLEERGRGSALD